MKRVQLWTAACIDGTIGAWAAILILEALILDDEGNQVKPGKVLSGRHPNTTLEWMWLTAAINGLSALKERCTVKLYTDLTITNDTFKKLQREHNVHRHPAQGYWAEMAMGIAEDTCETKAER